MTDDNEPLLNEDVVSISDGGGKALAALQPIRSRERVSRGVLLAVPELPRHVAGIDALEVAVECAIAGDAAGGDERAAPDGKFLRLRLYDPACSGIPRDEAAHVGDAGAGNIESFAPR